VEKQYQREHERKADEHREMEQVWRDEQITNVVARAHGKALGDWVIGLMDYWMDRRCLGLM
jgi:hypothetical protein